jgi:hypothetical protein
VADEMYKDALHAHQGKKLTPVMLQHVPKWPMACERARKTHLYVLEILLVKHTISDLINNTRFSEYACSFLYHTSLKYHASLRALGHHH